MLSLHMRKWLLSWMSWLWAKWYSLNVNPLSSRPSQKHRESERGFSSLHFRLMQGLLHRPYGRNLIIAGTCFIGISEPSITAVGKQNVCPLQLTQFPEEMIPFDLNSVDDSSVSPKHQTRRRCCIPGISRGSRSDPFTVSQKLFYSKAGARRQITSIIPHLVGAPKLDLRRPEAKGDAPGQVANSAVFPSRVHKSWKYEGP